MVSHRVTARSIRPQSFSASVTALALVLAACGGSVASNNADGGNSSGDDAGMTIDTGTVTMRDSGSPTMEASAPKEAGMDAPIDTGGPSSVYPAFPVDTPTVGNNGGPTLAAPVIVTVTWSTDPDATTYNTFDDTIGATSYWAAINSEYGVGPATGGAANHVSITTAPPASFADTDLDTLVANNAGTAWPANTPNTIYAVYLPPGSTLTFGGQDACQQGVGGYHEETQSAKIVYAIMPHCQGFQPADIQLSASHELNEAATDPHPNWSPAYVGFDNNHLAMEFFNQFQDELGDACELFRWTTDSTDFMPYTVQRQWSNKSALAGHDPCVPGVDGYNYNTTYVHPTDLDAISANLAPMGMGFSVTQTRGFKVAVGQSRTFQIGFFSDQPTSGPWTLDVQGGAGEQISQDAQGNAINNGNVTVTLDRTSGVNGEVANVTVKPTSYSTLGVDFFYIRSVLPGAQAHHFLPILVSAN